MTLIEAVATRMTEISDSLNRSISNICLAGGMTPSTVYDIQGKRTKSVKAITIKRFCLGAGMTLKEFFAPDYFNTDEE